MAHLNDKVADFFYEELPATEMVQARSHVAECADCRAQVQLFERTHLSLKSLRDVEPPRRVVFAAPERRVAWGVLDWRFLAPMAAAVAALVIAIMPAFSHAPASTPVPVAVTAPAPVSPASGVQPQPIDYDRIADQVRQSDRVWLARELDKRDTEIRQLQGQLAYYESYQRTVMKETWENASSIQLLAKRTSVQN
jgi:hypothetical protein